MIVKADAASDCQAIDSPLILGIQSDAPEGLLLVIRRVIDGDAIRDVVSQRVAHPLVEKLKIMLIVPIPEVETELRGMGAGHVGGRGPSRLAWHTSVGRTVGSPGT